MDWIVLTVLFIILGISAILIISTLVSLPQLGDERKNLIKMKAQSFTFAIVIGYALIEIFKKIYINIWKNGSYEGINPVIFLITTSIVYLSSLLFFRKKNGG
ncbi:putative membrane protein DUF2178 [Psychrobacillus insolitus]|uniref:Putative membrane protein DUF2178 n=1 Tax=Psychrobacillus insolitus TaxID=1461 RepID=A0A2W7P925_9BACI|nr:DUF2178 domain-containing protein [Psychrobacillus insolitus]PZX02453.1 putative membrane protein DUF2178 [Psychrobacillus insolitus]